MPLLILFALLVVMGVLLYAWAQLLPQAPRLVDILLALAATLFLLERFGYRLP